MNEALRNTPPTAPRLTMRQALWLAFAVPLLLVTATLLVASYTGTRELARTQADSLMHGVRRETESRLHRIFDPIRQKVTEDYASIRLGRYSDRDPELLKDRLYPNLFAIHQVDSLMIGDLTGSQFLVMRYTPAVHRASVLAPVAATLPKPPEGPALQFFTRDFRPAEWGETSRWTLWDESGRLPLRSWELPLSGYDGRQRPWHRAAMARFADIPLNDAHASGAQLVGWTEVYPLFTTKKPGISASIAARDPAGKILIVAYDLLLDEIAQFSTSATPTPHGQLFVLTEDERLLGPPQDQRPDAAQRSTAAIMQPVETSDYPLAAQSVEVWRRAHARAPGQFRLELAGTSWWAGFIPFEIGSGRLLWIAVLLPESDLVPAASAHQKTILIVGAIAVLLATLAAFWMARRLATPLTNLAEQARRLAALDLEPTPPVRSPVVELALLSETVIETRRSLQEGIAERERAAGALAQSEQQLRTLAENTPDIIVRVDRATRHLFVNPAHARATGFTPAQTLGRTASEIGYPSDLVPHWTRAIEQAGTTNEPVTLEFTYPTPAGPRRFEARFLHEPSTTTGGDTILGVLHDVTERTQAAAALARSEARYRTLIDSSLIGIVVHQDGIVRFANPAALALFGYDRADSVVDQVRWDEYVDPAFRDDLIARSLAALRGERPALHPGWLLLRADGQRRWVQSNVNAVEWDGRPALLSFLRDFTELRAANERQAALENQLQHAQKLEAVGLLAGGIAHDFNNLLQIIGGNAQLAEATAPGSEEHRDALREIGTTVHRAAKLTRQLLAFSRRQALAREDTDLNLFVAEHVQMVRRLIPQSIRLDFHPAAQPLVVHADRGQLEQVLLNLCVNARDAMPSGGVLDIRLDSIPLPADWSDKPDRPRATAFARIQISDTGHGMDEATRARIFDPFFTTKPRDKGTGLGLAVVYGIVHQHNGQIDVTSSPGEGTRFAIRLPLHSTQHVPAAPAPAPGPAQSRKTATILLAEDNEPIRRVAIAALQHAGFTVHAVADGQAAVELFEREAAGIDLLFFDVMMPRLGGFEAAKHCRALRPDIPVVFASGYAADSVEDGENIPAGAHVLPKPYRAEKLLELVDRLLATSRH